jgi:Domain of unknown function (DUF4160)
MSDNILVRITRSVRRRRLEKSLVELLNQLEWIDWRPRIRLSDVDTGIDGKRVKTLSDVDTFIVGKRVKTLKGIRIRMDGSKNHKRPHVHVDYGKEYHTASYAIDNGERIAGELEGKYDGVVSIWIAKCRPQLLRAWKLTQAGQNADEVICELRAA